MHDHRLAQSLRQSAILRLLTLCVALLSFATAGGLAKGETLEWAEEFNGVFDKTWVTTPGFPEPQVAGQPVDYLGAPTTAFETVDTQGVLRMTRTLGNLHRVGFHSTDTFDLSDHYVELRVNTLTQDLNHIDGLIELWLIDAADNTNFVRVCLFGSGNSTNRSFQAESSAGDFLEEPFEYANDTWYRLRLRVTPGLVVAEVRADVDDALLDSFEFAHDLTTSGSTYHIGVGQWMAFPFAALLVDSAVDYVRLYQVCAGEAAVTLDEIPGVACPGQSTVFQATSNVGTLVQVVWRKDGIDLNTSDPHYYLTSVGDAHTLEVWPTGIADAGEYTLYAVGDCGAAESNGRTLVVFATATGDVNEDGSTDGRDVRGFADLVIHGGFLVPGYCAADMDSSGFVDLDDVTPFVTRLLN